MTDTWPRAKQIAEYIVSDWMLLEVDERKMDTLVGFIEEELDKALTYGMRISHTVTGLSTFSDNEIAQEFDRRVNRFREDPTPYIPTTKEPTP